MARDLHVRDSRRERSNGGLEISLENAAAPRMCAIWCSLPALAVCPRGRELTLRSAICAHRTMITAPRTRHPGRDWVLCRVHVGRSRHCSSWCPERGIGRWPGRRYGRGRGQRLSEPDSHAHDGARGRGPVVSRVGLGLQLWAARRTSPAAARRICPGAAWLTCGPGPSRCWMLPTRRGWILLMRKNSNAPNKRWGPFRG